MNLLIDAGYCIFCLGGAMTREEELSRLKKLRNAIISKKDTEDTISECQAKLEKAKKE